MILGCDNKDREMSIESVLSRTQVISIWILRALYWYAEAIFRFFVPPPMKSINGETILVTGATGGIGKEICRSLVKSSKNVNLMLWDMNKATLDEFAGELKSMGISNGLKVYTMAVDISARENIDAACQKVKVVVGNPTIIFNNAGVACTGTFLRLTDDQIQNTYDVNLMSHIWIIRKFLPDMVANNYGHIVNTCSGTALKPSTHCLPYTSSKFAVNGYTEALKSELRLPRYNLDGIKFTSVYPYFVQTPLITTLALNPNADKKLPPGFNKFLTPEYVARRIVDGMRRNYEYIYLPLMIPIMCFLEYFVPLKLRRVIDSSYYDNIMFTDAEEHHRVFNSPYIANIDAKNSNTKLENKSN